MNVDDYKEYISAETMMGPNSIRILAELLDKYPLQLVPGDMILDLGCGTGLTSFIIAKETGAKVFANDLWISAEENGKRFAEWGVGEQVTPICEDANNIHFEKKQFRALISIDSYHYFAGSIASAYPLTISSMGYAPASVGSLSLDTVVLRGTEYELPEVLVESKKHQVLHMIGYVREYSTLTTYSDTVMLFREKTVDFMVPVGREKRCRG